MKRFVHFSIMVVAIACALSLSIAPVTAIGKANNGSQMHGKIAAMDTAARTVVVDVPVGKDTFTVGGPLSAKAAVSKGGKGRAIIGFEGW